ncbi:HypB (fragment) [uncultured Desulfobacterium sp.]|uniref:HypB n=1 Tax=uncultured Desulfobacterium sp. TaxID=201089 RepID=A0A445MU96_9BACT
MLNKIDLLPYVDCSLKKMREYFLRINPKLTVFEVYCKTGGGSGLVV